MDLFHEIEKFFVPPPPNNCNIANSSSKGNFGDISYCIVFIYQYCIVHIDMVQTLVLYVVMYCNFVL